MVRKFAVADASFERSPGQDGDVFAANLVDQRHGGPVTIGYGRVTSPARASVKRSPSTM